MTKMALVADDIYETIACPVCDANKPSTLYSRRARTATKLGDIEVTVAQCMACGFIYNSPRVRQAILSEYYFSSPLASGQVYRDEGPQGYYTTLNIRRVKFFSSFLKKQSHGQLLDIGCGVGGFLDALKKENSAGWQFCGLEPSVEAAKQASAKGYSVEVALLADAAFNASSFDAVSLVSVLEHLPDLHQTFTCVSHLLKPDGIVFIEVPNVLSPEISLTGFFSLEHIQHFTPNSLLQLLSEHGFTELVADVDATDNIIRIAASPKMNNWSSLRSEQLSDDREEATLAVEEYAIKEEKMLKGLTRRVGDSLDRWKNEGRTIAIYGAGVHTVELMKHFDLGSASRIFIDGDPKKQGTTFLEFPVYAPKQILELGVDAILVSSNRFQDEIIRNIRQVAGETIEIALCYDD